MSQDIVTQLTGALVNFTDLHDPFCLACDKAGMVKLFVKMTKELQDSIPHHIGFVVGAKCTCEFIDYNVVDVVLLK